MFFRFGFTVLFSLLIILMPEKGYVNAQVAPKGDCNSTLTCTAGHFCQYGTCRAMIGTNCATDGSTDECVQNITCSTASNPCACPANQVAKADNTGCVAINNVGGVCTRDVECLTNGACGADGKCACKTNFVSSYDSSSCKLAVNQTCSGSGECGENSDCTATKCACKTGFTANNGRCAKTVGTQCANQAECSLMAECLTNSTCACKNPYVRDSSNNFCTTATASTTTSSATTASTTVNSNTLQGVGEQCDGTKKCRTDLICDHDVCKLKLGADCTLHNGNCQTGTSCNNQHHNCTIADKKSGGSCSASDTTSCEDKNAQCTGGICKCNDGFSVNQEDFTCKKNGATSLLASLLVVVGVLVTSRLI